MSRVRPAPTRFVPDTSRLCDLPNNITQNLSAVNGALDPHSLNYERSDLSTITRRQMDEDIRAYRYDMEFCRDQLTSAPDITPQEVRTLQIRVLDCGHNIRHCQHRIAQLDAQAREAALAAANSNYGVAQSHRASTNHTPRSGSGVKRPRASKAADSDDDHTAEFDMLMDLDGSGTTSIQRLGFWKCRLCTSQKYLNAGASRVPSAPCKWPLKDVSKILNHCLDMHTEHTPQERCQELGAALSHNRGPFEYWLTRTRGQELEDMAIIGQLINILQSGTLPEVLRPLNRAARAFPNTVSGIKR